MKDYGGRSDRRLDIKARKQYIPDLGEFAASCLGLGKLAAQHALDCWADQGGLAEDDELPAIGRDECNVLAGST